MCHDFNVTIVIGLICSDLGGSSSYEQINAVLTPCNSFTITELILHSDVLRRTPPKDLNVSILLL